MVEVKNENKNKSIRGKFDIKAHTDFLESERLNPEQVSIKISAIYVFAGALWILLSDEILGRLVSDKALITSISLIKGWAYVIATGLLIYYLVHSAFMKLKDAEDRLYMSYQHLSEANTELEAANDQLAQSQSELRVNFDWLMENQKKLEKSEHELEYQAYHDQLTGIHNRFALITHMNKLIDESENGKAALLNIDIDNFKYINDTMGHSFGDQVLRRVSSRMEAALEENSSLYRLSGDGFVVILEDFESISSVENVAIKLLKSFKQPFDISGSSIFITASIGIALYPGQGDNLDELLKNAYTALYKAKETGNSCIVFYNRPMKEEVSERVLIEKHLRTALNNNEFDLHYQPQLDIASGKISGFEALLRWKSPELGMVSPLRFIGIAEDTHLIIPIGEWVLKNACTYLKSLHQQGYNELAMSVNVSILQLLQEDFVDKVMEVLDNLKLNPRYLELEITESILMESYEVIAGKLKLLKGRGVRIALDDFGKGYSSLNYLKQLPISTLKIDKSFIDTISAVGMHQSLTNLIVKIGKAMGMSVVAEGVETQEQLDYLIKYKCDKIQGYLFSKPLPGDKVFEVLREHEDSTDQKEIIEERVI